MDKEKLILDNLALINLMIKKLNCRCKTQDEYQEYYDYGLEGLIRGAKKYDESKGAVSTFLCACIRNEIIKCFYLKQMPKRFNPAGADISLNFELYEDNLYGYTELGELLEDPNVNIEEEVETKEKYRILLEAVNDLKNVKDRVALKMYYGLDGYEQSNYLEIAKKFGVSKNCICTRIHRALKKLRLYYEKIGVDYFGRIRWDLWRNRRRLWWLSLW